MPENEDARLVKVLQFFLSLHEAEEIYNMIFDDNFSTEQMEERLKEFTGWKEAEEISKRPKGRDGSDQEFPWYDWFQEVASRTTDLGYSAWLSVKVAEKKESE